jgi:hypothetical protein
VQIKLDALGGSAQAAAGATPRAVPAA